MASGNYNADPALCPDAFGNCVYGSAPAHLNAWSKSYLGWITPQAPATAPDPGSMSLGNVEQNGDVIKLPASTDAITQYYLIENRQAGPLSGIANYDQGLPGSGLLVWLVDEYIINLNLASNSVNNSFFRPGVKLIEADGDFALQNGSDGDLGSAGDPFPGSTNNEELSPLTAPSSLPVTPYGWVNLKSISLNSGVINLDMGFSPLPPQDVSFSGNTVSWSPNGESDFSFYTIYKNGIYLDQTTAASFTDNAALNGDTYTITAVDSNNNESPLSEQVTKIIPSSGGDGGFCFIATAAYGSYLDPHVGVLRDFRDRYLLTNRPGRAIVGFYYQHSPPLADIIGRHEGLRVFTRAILTPMVYAVQYPLHALFFMVILFVIWLGFFLKRYGHRAARNTPALFHGNL